MTMTTAERALRVQGRPTKAVRRFVFVRSPDSNVKHLYYGQTFVEGEQTACGIRMRAGWEFAYRAKHFKGPYCRRCEEAKLG